MMSNCKIPGTVLLALVITAGFPGLAAAKPKATPVAKPPVAASESKASENAGKGTSAQQETPAAEPASADAAAEQAAMQGASPDLKDRLVLSHDKFALLDANKDGFIERDEATASNILQARFDKYDTNHDGKLSVLEFAAINDLASIKPPPTPDPAPSTQ